jgi:hypothetical protein
MTDVKPEIAELQMKLFMQLPQEQRIMIGLQMCEDAMKIMVGSVRAEFPDATEEEFKIHMLRRLKRNDPEKLAWVKV